MNGRLSFSEFLTIMSLWIAAAAIVYFAQPISSGGWLIDLFTVGGAYYLSKFIILKKD